MKIIEMNTHKLSIFTITLLLMIMSVGNAVAFDPANPSIDIEKSTNGVDADDSDDAPEILVGSDVTWTYTVTNTGNVDLTNVVVADDKIGDPLYNVGNLSVGESFTFDATEIGSAALGLYTNVGTARGEYGETLVSDTDPSHYFGVEDTEIPEFPTIALPVVAVLGLALFFQHRKDYK
ncbi:PEF-CTERM sorting domain-containing protein [Methanolobus sp. ZRKC5]|uniref:DUF7507 domain-containing protein n=1 Tax=unclassified Methanolobus TaxID=2629569 RepID=UPI00313D4242